MNTKNCQQCNNLMIRPRWKNGKLDSMWKHRKFCSSRCYGLWVEAQGRAKRKSGRKTAQRRVTMRFCNKCGATLNLQRHHKDRNPNNNHLENIEVLCQTCHKEDHMKDNTWGIYGWKNRIYQELRQELLTEFTDLER